MRVKLRILWWPLWPLWAQVMSHKWSEMATMFYMHFTGLAKICKKRPTNLGQFLKVFHNSVHFLFGWPFSFNHNGCQVYETVTLCVIYVHPSHSDIHQICLFGFFLRINLNLIIQSKKRELNKILPKVVLDVVFSCVDAHFVFCFL